MRHYLEVFAIFARLTGCAISAMYSIVIYYHKERARVRYILRRVYILLLYDTYL